MRAMYKFWFQFFSTSAFSRAPPHKWIKAIKKSLAKTEKSVLIEIENTSELFSFLLHFRSVANGLFFSLPLSPFFSFFTVVVLNIFLLAIAY